MNAQTQRTGESTHRATQRGYAIEPSTGAGQLVEPGEFVPPNQPISQAWMIEADKYRAPQPNDPPQAPALASATMRDLS